MPDSDVSTGEKVASLKRVVRYRPLLTGAIVVFSLFTTVIEGVGLTFLFPVIELARGGSAADIGGMGRFFVQAYDVAGIPFTLEFLLLGLSVVMVVRYASTFVSKWLAARLVKNYEQDLKQRAYRLALGATVAYYDDKGSDDILNAIITETRYSGKVIGEVVVLVQQALLALAYAAVALVVAPVLTLLSGLVLGGITYLMRAGVESGYVVGDRIASANERLQESVQAGTQGIRDVKLFGMRTRLLDEFERTLRQYTDASVAKRRNQVAISSFYQLSVALTLFGLVYVAISQLTLSISALGVFLLAMLRFSPQISHLNSVYYSIESGLPHLVRSHRFIERLSEHQERTDGTQSVPERPDCIRFEDVGFAYGDDPILDDVSLEFRHGEFVGIVGPSGAGKSTVVSLLARLYERDTGEIRVDGTPIESFDLGEWRDHVAMVRQNPHVFNDTLRYNLTTGRDVSERRLHRAAETARVTEFLADLPEGYDTVLGDDGVKLSGGQRQRVALARALVTDPTVLILDEATSDLDSSLEQEVHEALGTNRDGRITIAIAHRLSTVRDADRIYSMADGRVVEEGSHRTLLANDGTYANLYTLQSTEIEQA